MLEIDKSKVVQVIFQSREGRMGQQELVEFIAAMDEDEQAQIVALAWVGRGVYDAQSFDEALKTAYEEHTTSAARYLSGMPDLPENLEAGLEAMGIDVSGEEEDFLRHN